MGVISAVFLIVITIFLPPLGVFMVAGCGADFWINVCLTILGYFPGHIHAFYIEFVYFDRKKQAKEGRIATRAPGVYSERVQSGGRHNYGTVNQPPAYT